MTYRCRLDSRPRTWQLLLYIPNQLKLNFASLEPWDNPDFADQRMSLTEVLTMGRCQFRKQMHDSCACTPKCFLQWERSEDCAEMSVSLFQPRNIMLGNLPERNLATRIMCLQKEVHLETTEVTGIKQAEELHLVTLLIFAVRAVDAVTLLNAS